MAPDTQTVTTADGIRIAFDHYHHSNSATVLIICHGFFKSKATPTFQRLSQVLAVDRDVIAMDFRGHGNSSGLFTFSAHEQADVEAVLQWAHARYARIALMGFSLGGAVAITTASRHPQLIQYLIAVSAPSDFKDIEFQWWTPHAMKTGLRGLERGSGCRPGNLFLKKERPLDAVTKLDAIPKLFIHGTKDVIVGLEHSRRLYAAASDPKRLEIITGGSHAEALFRDDPEGFCRLVQSWWTDTLRNIVAEQPGINFDED